MANYCCDEAFRDDDRAPAVMKSVFEDERDWLCSVQAFLGTEMRYKGLKLGPSLQEFRK
jgi:hypothetical protein